MISLSVLDAWIAARIGASLPLSREDIEAWQLIRLQETLELACSNSPFYRQKLQGLPAPEGLQDLANLPCTSEAELRANSLAMLCVSQNEVQRSVSLASSGTTGSPKRLFFSEGDLELTMDFFHHGMAELVSPGQRVLILLPGDTPDSTGDLLARALARMEVQARILGLVSNPEAAVQAAVDFQAHCLVGFPLHLLAMARCCEHSHPDWRPASVLLCSDYIANSVKRELSRIWQCACHSHYGTVETGLGGGVECSALDGVHLREADLLVEILDPAGNKPLPLGKWGEITFTTLTRQAMPLVRYRTGDLGRLMPGRCACGSSIARLDQVQGRLGQRFPLADGSALTMGRLDELLLDLPGIMDFRPWLEYNSIEAPLLRLELLALDQSVEAVAHEAHKRLQKEFAGVLQLEIEALTWSPGAVPLGKRQLHQETGA